MHTYTTTKYHLQIDLPIGDLLGNHLGDKSRFHSLLDKFAESVVGIRSIENNVCHVIEHADEALQGEVRKKLINKPSNLVDGTKSLFLHYSVQKQKLAMDVHDTMSGNMWCTCDVWLPWGHMYNLLS